MTAHNAQMLRAYNSLAITLFFILQLMDLATSAIGGRLGHPEKNPLLTALVEEYGFGLAVGTSKALACALIIVFWRLCPSPWLRAIVLTATCFAYANVVIGNINVISSTS